MQHIWPADVDVAVRWCHHVTARKPAAYPRDTCRPDSPSAARGGGSYSVPLPPPRPFSLQHRHHPTPPPPPAAFIRTCVGTAAISSTRFQQSQTSTPQRGHATPPTIRRHHHTLPPKGFLSTPTHRPEQSTGFMYSSHANAFQVEPPPVQQPFRITRRPRSSGHERNNG